MAKKDTNFDVAVVGAGPAGLIAAGTAASLGLKVVLIEKNATAGKKLLLTGNGRCNLTNSQLNLRELVKSFNNGEFLFHAFSVFGPKETIEFFNKLGVETKIENNNRVFPVSNDSEEILDALKNYLQENKVETIFNTEVTDVKKVGKKISRLITNNGEVIAKNYIFTTGGKSFATVGSNGVGYKLAEKLGHTIVNPLPALSPIRISELWVKNLQGISLKDVKLTILQNNKKIFSEEGEFIFTHYGIGGPAVLNISGRVADLLQKGPVKISIDLFPLLNNEQLLKGLEEILNKYLNRSSKNILSIFVPERLAETLLDVDKISKEKIANNMSKAEKIEIVKILKNIEITPENVFSFDEAHVTRGGILLKEIDHKTMKSKIVSNLSFAGEIIDVDGKSGGFNLQMCWSTGYLSGKNCR